MKHQDFKIPQAQPRKKVKVAEPLGQQQMQTTNKLTLDPELPDVVLDEAEPELTPKSLFMLHNQLQQAIDHNRQLRFKYAAEPQRFYESEAELNRILEKLADIGAYPELIPIYVKCDFLKSLQKLLNHQNEYIVGQTVQSICEFITMDVDQVDDTIFEAHLNYCLRYAQKEFGAALVAGIKRMDENEIEQYQVAYKSMRILQQLLEFSPSFADVLADSTPLFEYLTDRIMPNYQIAWKPIDDNKYISSEILVQMIQDSQHNRFTLKKFEGVAVLLESIRVYSPQETTAATPKNPTTNQDEKEYLSNLFNALSIMLADSEECRAQFNDEKGVNLMLSFIKAKTTEYSTKALKCLSFGFTAKSCVSFVETFGGLKYLFPILMRQGLKEKLVEDQKSIDQNTLRIVRCLVDYCEGICLDRVLNKFKEKNFQKLLRLVELRVQYADLMGGGTQQPQAMQQTVSEDDYLAKLSQGLNIVELVDGLILGLSIRDSQLRCNAKEMLKYFNISGTQIANVLDRQLRNLVPQSLESQQLSSLIKTGLSYFTNQL